MSAAAIHVGNVDQTCLLSFLYGAESARDWICYRERERQTDRDGETETDRQTDRDRRTDRRTDRPTFL